MLKAKPERTDDSFPEDSTSFRNQAHVPSFTAASTLESELLARAVVQAPDNGGSQEVDVVGAEDKGTGMKYLCCCLHLCNCFQIVKLWDFESRSGVNVVIFGCHLGGTSYFCSGAK